MCDWPLLSDEIAFVQLNDLKLIGLGRPTILKGESIRLMKERYGDRTKFGPVGQMMQPKTPIAHLRPTETSVAISGQTFTPAAIVGSKPRPHRYDAS